MITKNLVCCAVLVSCLSLTQIVRAQEENHPATRHLLKNMAAAQLTDDQTAQINEQAKATAEKIGEVREASGLTFKMIKKRTAALKKFRKTGLKGQELTDAVKEEIGLTQEQFDAAVEVEAHRRSLKEFAIELLTDQQKNALPKMSNGTNASKGQKKMAENTTAASAQTGGLIFEDDFERSESQEVKDEIGNGWKSNSESRAKGNKQVDLRDGAMHITMHAEADHAVSVTHPAEFTNGKVTLRFMLKNEGDSLGLNFADLKFKEVHAGHLCMTKIGTKNVQIDDLKTGRMANASRAARKAGTETEEMKKALKAKTKRFPNELTTGSWHDLEVRIEGQTMIVAIDSQEVGSFTSEGIAHPTKRTLRVAVPKSAVVDDVKIYSLAN